MRKLSRVWLVAAFAYVGLVFILLGLGKSMGGDLGGSEGWILAYKGLWGLAYPAGHVILLAPFSDAMGPLWTGALLGAIGFSQWFLLWPVLCRVLTGKSHPVTAFLTTSIFIMSAYFGVHGISARDTLHSDAAHLAMILSLPASLPLLFIVLALSINPESRLVWVSVTVLSLALRLSDLRGAAAAGYPGRARSEVGGGQATAPESPPAGSVTDKRTTPALLTGLLARDRHTNSPTRTDHNQTTNSANVRQIDYPVQGGNPRGCGTQIRVRGDTVHLAGDLVSRDERE